MLSADQIDTVLGGVEPDLQPMLTSMQSHEDWVHAANDIPELVKELADMLPEVVTLPIDMKYVSVVDRLIKALAHMDAKIFFVTMLYLERGSFTVDKFDRGPGWGSFLYVRANELAGEGTVESLEAKAVLSRLYSVMRSAKIVEIFLTNISTNTARNREL